MSLSKNEFSNYIRQFKFYELFNEMGWNNDRTTEAISINDATFMLKSVAEKSGFKIMLCTSEKEGILPDYDTRKKIETKITKLFQEHLIIYIDDQKKEQIWQFVIRRPSEPIKVTEMKYHISQDTEFLFQKVAGIFFELDEEDKITIVDVTQRVSENFQQNNERVTKKFYDEFRNEHKSFISFIKGIESTVNREWYSSLMLNRLMFCYFIQKKGFLDNNKNYLRDKLNICKERKGKNKFYSFYRDFLLVLFRQGLNEPSKNKEMVLELGKIPYLNGGMFDEHELEKEYDNIEIDDEAFENIFDFFDEYNWHLDTRIDASGKDINPDVIGYIFEKYINDRAQMGAYYTKEDITEYISKNCILPYLFEETKRQYVKAFIPESEIWQMVKRSGDKYIYETIKHGISEELPEEVAIGIENIDARTEWNKPVPITYALPTEIWREVIARRNHYAEVKTKIEEGKVTNINDFITYNLNIRQFVQDIIENTNDTELLKSLYKALTNITILDPTCGSGAFLFAAMNILEPLYEACIQRMENFVSESPKGKYKYFEDILIQIRSSEHPNLQYFIYKKIILSNLYGVDIMKEAVEIAKLRLFLKLVATVDADYYKPNLGLEPLPDIDFNIRAGNTLVGFATETELDKAFEGKMDFDDDKGKIKERCDVVARTFSRYKDIQLTHGDDFESFKKAKEELNKRLKALNDELSLLLHKHNYANVEYNKWLASHQPFHWFSEFYEIIHDRSGFDIIIGNPPYVVYTKKDSKTKLSIADQYKLTGYDTLSSNNLYAFIIERVLSISSKKSLIGMIIPISSISSDKFQPLQKMFQTKLLPWFSSYSNRPAKLFEGVEQRLTIFIAIKMDNDNQYYSSSYNHWYSDTREYLFMNIKYLQNTKQNIEISFSKVGSDIEKSIMSKIANKSNWKLGRFQNLERKFLTYYHDSPTYFIRAMSFKPNSGPNNEASTHYREICFSNILKKSPTCILNSTLFYFFFKNYSNCRDFSDREILAFSLGEMATPLIEKLNEIENKLRESYEENKELKSRIYDSGLIKYEEFYPSKSKNIIDEIDKILAEHYCFTEEELDFIINYDYKYRMGKEQEEGNELQS